MDHDGRNSFLVFCLRRVDFIWGPLGTPRHAGPRENVCTGNLRNHESAFAVGPFERIRRREANCRAGHGTLRRIEWSGRMTTGAAAARAAVSRSSDGAATGENLSEAWLCSGHGNRSGAAKPEPTH